jgi:hypothetical protein
MNPTSDDGLGTRHATLQDLAVLLRGQKARKIDVIAPASAIHARNGLILLDDTAPDLTPDGVGMTTGTYRPTGVCDAGIAEKLAIPAAYLRRAGMITLLHLPHGRRSDAVRVGRWPDGN